MAKFSFGADPEFMIIDTNGKYRSAIGIVKGNKENKVSLGNEHYAFYDNVLAEVNIKASHSKTETIKNFGDCFKRLANLIGNNFRILPQASHTYDIKECQHPDAQVFGCDPEFSIYNKDENGCLIRVEPPVSTPDNTFRSGGGHIHVGHPVCLPWDGGNPIRVVELLDCYVGIAAVCMDHDPTSAARRKLYGGAGTHRLKLEYGVEYRSLSNFWLVSPVLVNVIYDLVDFVLDIAVKNKNLVVVNTETQKIINNGDRKKAMMAMTEKKNHMPEKLYNEIMSLTKPVKFDFYKEWKLT